MLISSCFGTGASKKRLSETLLGKWDLTWRGPGIAVRAFRNEASRYAERFRLSGNLLHVADRLAGLMDGVSRRRRPDSPAAHRSRDFLDSSLCAPAACVTLKPFEKS